MCPSETPEHWIIQAHQAKKKCWVQETAFLQTLLPPFAFFCLLLHFICMQYLPKTWTFTTQTRRCRPLASDFSVSCWICAWLIFLAHWKTFYRKLSLMINGCHVNRRCGICKWLCMWCAARSLVRYHMGGFSMFWIQKRGRLIWKGFLGVSLVQAYVTVGISSPYDAGYHIKGDWKMNPVYDTELWLNHWCLAFETVRSFMGGWTLGSLFMTLAFTQIG